jgi:hypothetical protein
LLIRMLALRPVAMQITKKITWITFSFEVCLMSFDLYHGVVGNRSRNSCWYTVD